MKTKNTTQLLSHLLLALGLGVGMAPISVQAQKGFKLTSGHCPEPGAPPAGGRPENPGKSRGKGPPSALGTENPYSQSSRRIRALKILVDDDNDGPVRNERGPASLYDAEGVTIGNFSVRATVKK